MRRPLERQMQLELENFRRQISIGSGLKRETGARALVSQSACCL
jgi:hypothetical protein